MSTEPKKVIAWQKFGNDWCLTGQWGMRPILLSVMHRPKAHLALYDEKTKLLVPFTPDHPFAKRIVEALNRDTDREQKLETALKLHLEFLSSLPKGWLAHTVADIGVLNDAYIASRAAGMEIPKQRD